MDNIRFIYATDLHGNVPKYERVLEAAIEGGYKLIHLGADLLPKGSGIFKMQKDFVLGYLRDYHRRATEVGIEILSFFGNDDIYLRKKYFREYARLLDESPHEVGGYRFTAYGYVPDYPFGLKTACKRDHDGWVAEAYISRPVEVDEKVGFVGIEDVTAYFDAKGTIAADLETFEGGPGVIAAIHTPPAGLKLDVCGHGRCVGSKAVTDWIKKAQPTLVLGGHIHESPECTGVWKVEVGATVVIQPGQPEGGLCYVTVEVDGGTVAVERVIDRDRRFIGSIR